MKYKIITIICIFCVAMFSNNVHANNYNEGISYSNYAANFVKIPFRATLEPFRGDKKGIKRNLIIATGVGLTLAYDQDIRDYVQDEVYGGSNSLSRFLYNVGSKDYAIPGFLGVYAISAISGNRYFFDTMNLSFQSLLITQMFTEITKGTVNRIRPRSSPDDPFNREDDAKSFFSGHASGTWAVASVFAKRYPSFQIPVYTLATSVSLSRVYEDAHWMSDVLVGSLVGYGIASLTIRLNDAYPNNQVQVSPVFDGDSVGATIGFRW